MERDDLLKRAPGDPLALAVKQELDAFSVDDIEARIVMLEREIARCRARIDVAVNHRASFQGLFRR